jgi:hypothetical protein
MENKIFGKIFLALGLSYPWQIRDIRFERVSESEVELHIHACVPHLQDADKPVTVVYLVLHNR